MLGVSNNTQSKTGKSSIKNRSNPVDEVQTILIHTRNGIINQIYSPVLIECELKIMDKDWLKELNKRNLAVAGEDSSKWDFATVSLSSSVLNKLSQTEQAKFKIGEFTRATNEIEHWARIEEICDFFGVEDPDLAGEIYVRRFKNLNADDESKWQDLRDINDEIPEGFGVKVNWR